MLLVCLLVAAGCGGDGGGDGAGRSGVAWSEQAVEEKANAYYDSELPGEHEIDCEAGLSGDGDFTVCRGQFEGRPEEVVVYVEANSDEAVLRFGDPGDLSRAVEPSDADLEWSEAEVEEKVADLHEEARGSRPIVDCTTGLADDGSKIDCFMETDNGEFGVHVTAVDGEITVDRVIEYN